MYRKPVSEEEEEGWWTSPRSTIQRSSQENKANHRFHDLIVASSIFTLASFTIFLGHRQVLDQVSRKAPSRTPRLPNAGRCLTSASPRTYQGDVIQSISNNLWIQIFSKQNMSAATLISNIKMRERQQIHEFGEGEGEDRGGRDGDMQPWPHHS